MQKNKKYEIRIGIVGTGAMAELRSRSFLKTAQTRVVGVYTRNAEKAQSIKNSTGAKIYLNYQKFLSEVDAVVVCVPNYLHMAFAREALAAGKHVLVEYPLCINSEEVNILRASALSSEFVLMVGNTIIHEAMFRYIRQHRKELGKLVSASSRVAFYDEKNSAAWYMNKSNIGNIFIAFLYHHIEYYRNLLGEVAWVIGRNESIPNKKKTGFYDFHGGTLLMTHQEGGTSCIQWYLATQGSGLSRGMWLNGLLSSVTIISHKEGKSLAVWNSGGNGKVEVYDDEWGVTGSCRDFVRAIEGKLDHRTRFDSDLTTLKVGLAAAESAKLGSIVKIT